LTYQVVTEKLHDESRVLVALLAESVELCICVSFCFCICVEDSLTSNSVIKSSLGKVACLVWGVEDLVVEDGEVESKTKTDWVGWSQLGLSNLGGSLVSLKGLVGRSLALVTSSELSKVTVVVSLPGGLSVDQSCLSENGDSYILW